MERLTPDRRIGPQRLEEVTMHYSTLGLLAAALRVAESYPAVDQIDELNLRSAAAAYREAERSIQARGREGVGLTASTEAGASSAAVAETLVPLSPVSSPQGPAPLRGGNEPHRSDAAGPVDPRSVLREDRTAYSGVGTSRVATRAVPAPEPSQGARQ